MKIIIFTLFFFIPILCKSMSTPYYPCIEIGSAYKICPDPRGGMEHAEVTYNSRRVQDADPMTFSVIGKSYYAKDKNNIYFEGVKLEFMTPDTFEYIEHDYAKDKGRFLYRGKIIEGVDIGSVEILNSSYFKDKNSVYFQGLKIEWANPKTFYIIDYSCYSKDKKNIFWCENKIKKADYNTFVLLNSFVAKDKNNTYYAGRIIDYIDPKTIEVFEYDNIIKDKDKVYYSLNPIETIDIKSFKYLGPGYIKDKNNVYYNGEILEGADAETFEYNSNRYNHASDKNGEYRYGMKVKTY